jgi:hypothetical protein
VSDGWTSGGGKYVRTTDGHNQHPSLLLLVLLQVSEVGKQAMVAVGPTVPLLLYCTKYKMPLNLFLPDDPTTTTRRRLPDKMSGKPSVLVNYYSTYGM